MDREQGFRGFRSPAASAACIIVVALNHIIDDNRDSREFSNNSSDAREFNNDNSDAREFSYRM